MGSVQNEEEAGVWGVYRRRKGWSEGSVYRRRKGWSVGSIQKEEGQCGIGTN